MPREDDILTPEDWANRQKAENLRYLFQNIPGMASWGAYSILKPILVPVRGFVPPSDPFTASLTAGSSALRNLSPMTMLLGLGGSQSDLAKPKEPRLAQPLNPNIPRPGNFATAKQWENYLAQASLFARGSSRKPKRKQP